MTVEEAYRELLAAGAGLGRIEPTPRREVPEEWRRYLRAYRRWLLALEWNAALEEAS